MQSKGSVLLMEPSAQLRKRLANFYRTEGWVVYEAGHASEIHSAAAISKDSPGLIVVKLDRNRPELHAQILKLQAKSKIKIPVVILAKELDSDDLKPMVEAGARSVILNLEHDTDWEAKVRETLCLVKKTAA